MESKLDTEHMDLDNDLPKLPLPLVRTYKAWCSFCEVNMAYVFNHERKGGICWVCKYHVKAAWQIQRWYRRYRHREQRGLALV